MSQHEANEIAREAQRRWRGRGMLKIALPTAAALGAGAAIAVGSIPGSGGTITGCYAGTDGATVEYPPPPGATGLSRTPEPPGALRVIDPSLPKTLTIGGSPLGAAGGETIPNPAATCVNEQETQITWNQTGPAGPQGPQGPAGGQGANGAGGAPGSPLVGGTEFGISGAPGNTFLKIESAIKGELKLDSFTIGAHATNIGSQSSGAGAGKATIQSFTITKQLDASSPLLFQGEARGTDYKEVAVIFERKAGDKQQTYLEYKFQDVLISSIVDGTSYKEQPTEEVTFNFQKCTETLLPAVRGASPVSFNINANAKI